MAYKFDTPHTLATIEKLLALLEVKPRTRDELQVALGLSKPAMRNYLGHLMAEPRHVYIKRWAPTTGNLAPVYAKGRRKDAKRPIRPSMKERQVLRWQKIKADPDKHKHYLHRHRVGAAVRRLRSNPQTWLSALMPGPVGAKPRELPNRRAEHAEQ